LRNSGYSHIWEKQRVPCRIRASFVNYSHRFEQKRTEKRTLNTTINRPNSIKTRRNGDYSLFSTILQFRHFLLQPRLKPGGNCPEPSPTFLRNGGKTGDNSWFIPTRDDGFRPVLPWVFVIVALLRCLFWEQFLPLSHPGLHARWAVCAELSPTFNNGQKYRSGPPDESITDINPHSRIHLPAHSQRSDGRQEQTPLCATYPNHRVIKEGYPVVIQSFIRSSLGRGETSAQNSLPSLTPLRTGELSAPHTQARSRVRAQALVVRALLSLRSRVARTDGVWAVYPGWYSRVCTGVYTRVQ